MAAGLLAALVLIASACGEEHSNAASEAVVTAGCMPDDLHAKIGQTIMIGFPGRRESDPGVKAIRAQLQEGTVGGVVLFPDNISSKAQLKALIAALRETRSDLPPL